MKTYLALDTATTACSVALCHGGEERQEITLEARQHTRVILPMIQTLLAESGLSLSQVDGIICSSGPGAFTGLRVGAAVVMGLAMGADCPILPLSSLALLAATAEKNHPQKRFLTLLDARMGEVYAAVYHHGKCLQAEILQRPEALPAAYHEVDLAVGVGTDLLETALPRMEMYPEARAAFSAIPEHARWQAPTEALVLNYLRNNVVQS